MPTTSKKVLLSIIPARVKKLYRHGEYHEMECVTSGNLKLGTICGKTLNFIMSLYSDAKVDKYLKDNDVRLHDLIREAIEKHISPDP